MLNDDMRKFLDRPLIARLATMGADGYPHNVPIWFMADGDDIVFISDRDTRKVKNAAAQPRAAVTIGGDPSDGEAYLIRGDITIEEDPGQQMTRRMIDRYEPEDNREAVAEAWKEDDIIVLRLKPQKVTKVY